MLVRDIESGKFPAQDCPRTPSMKLRRCEVGGAEVGHVDRYDHLAISSLVDAVSPAFFTPPFDLMCGCRRNSPPSRKNCCGETAESSNRRTLPKQSETGHVASLWDLVGLAWLLKSDCTPLDILAIDSAPVMRCLLPSRGKDVVSPSTTEASYSTGPP